MPTTSHPSQACALVAAIALAGCQPQTGIVAMKCPTIPHPREAGPPPPRPATDTPVALAPGHWDWGVGSYDWTPPAWLPRPPHPHWAAAPTIWQNGFWTPDAGACVWHAGHFVS